MVCLGRDGDMIDLMKEGGRMMRKKRGRMMEGWVVWGRGEKGVSWGYWRSGGGWRSVGRRGRGKYGGDSKENGIMIDLGKGMLWG